MLENHVRNIKTKRFGNSFTIPIFLFCALFAFLMYYTDPGPLNPPFSTDFKSIDCKSVEFKSVVDRNGDLDFIFSSGETIEYPQEYLPYFVNAKIKTRLSYIEYEPKYAENITRMSEIFKFSIPHTQSGHSQIDIYCLDKKIAYIEKDLKYIKNYSNKYSFVNFYGKNGYELNNVCLEYQKFLYFTKIESPIVYFPFDQDQFKFEYLKWPLQPYLDHKNVTEDNDISYMLAYFNDEPWKQLLFNVNPLANAIAERIGSFPDGHKFIFRHDVDNKSIEILKYFGNKEPMKLADIQCFDQLVLIEADSHVDIHNQTMMEFALNSSFTFAIQRLSRKSIQRNKVVVSESLYDNLSDVTSNVEKISPNTPLHEAIQIASTANVFVADHISTLVYSIFLSKKATIIDLTNQSYTCNPMLGTFLNNSKAKKNRVFYDENCQCKDFSCYPEHPESDRKIDYEMVKGLIRKTTNV